MAAGYGSKRGFLLTHVARCNVGMSAGYGSKLTIASRLFASSKACFECGYALKEMPLAVRRWECLQCETVHARYGR
ncbi:MAG: zinc ribbon domain-containing protein [Bacillota bacterium]|jgi:hypothetical protein